MPLIGCAPESEEIEALALVAAIRANCTCGERAPCGPHTLLHDQANIHRLTFARRNVARLLLEEFTLQPRPDP